MKKFMKISRIDKTLIVQEVTIILMTTGLIILTVVHFF